MSAEKDENHKMSEEKAPPPPPASIVDKVLAYVDSPFKLISILVMGVVAFVGYGIWQNQSFILAAYQEQRRMPSINEDRADDAATLLFKQTDAAVVAIFKVNPILGTRVLFRLYTKEGRAKSLEGIDVGLFTSNVGNNNDVVKLMAGETPCGEYKRAQSEIGVWYIANGVGFTCRTGVPPDRTRFIGQITAGWTAEPADMENARAMMEVASSMLTKRGN